MSTKEDSLRAETEARVYKQVPSYTEEPSIQMGSTIDIYLTLDTNKIVHTVNPQENESNP